MKKLLIVATILAVIALTLRMAASVLHIEKMMMRWYEVDFTKLKINLPVGEKPFNY